MVPKDSVGHGTRTYFQKTSYWVLNSVPPTPPIHLSLQLVPKSTMSTKALNTFNWGFPRGFPPWALPVGSIFPSTFRRSMERSLGKCKAAHRILAAQRSRWSEKFKQSPGGLKRSKNRFLGEIFIKHIYKQAHSNCFFCLFSRVETLRNIWGFPTKKECRDSGGEGVKDDDFRLEWFWVCRGRPSGLFIFVFIRYVGGITGYIFKQRNFICREYCKLVYKYYLWLCF